MGNSHRVLGYIKETNTYQKIKYLPGIINAKGNYFFGKEGGAV